MRNFVFISKKSYYIKASYRIKGGHWVCVLMGLGSIQISKSDIWDKDYASVGGTLGELSALLTLLTLNRLFLI